MPSDSPSPSTGTPTTSPPRSPPTKSERRVEVLKLQSAARNSTEWFENVARYTHLEPEQFAYSLLTRSQRISHENLRLRDRAWLEGIEGWLAARANGGTPNRPIPPMFLPFRLRDMQLEQPHRGLADGDLQRARRHAERLPPRASRRARTWRRRPGVHRDDLRHAARPHHARLRRHVHAKPRCRHGSASSISCTGRCRREDLPAARPFRPERLDQAWLGRHGRAARSPAIGS